MRGLIPYGGLTIASGSQTLALTGTATLFNLWSATGGGVSVDTTSGDPAVIPDKANNRIKVNTIGVYWACLELSGTIDGAVDVTLQFRKNGNVISDMISKSRWSTNKNVQTLAGLIQIVTADNPGNLPTFADPSQASGAGKPSGGFAGAGGAPQTEVALDIMIGLVSGSQTITAENARFTVMRVG